MRDKPIVVKNVWLPFGSGVTLYPFIFVEKGKVDTFKHECMHWYQMERMGVLRFYWEILKEYLTVGRYKGPLEQEAYVYKYSGPLTAKEQEWWDEH